MVNMTDDYTKITLNIVRTIAASVLYPAFLYDDIQRVI